MKVGTVRRLYERAGVFGVSPTGVEGNLKHHNTPSKRRALLRWQEVCMNHDAKDLSDPTSIIFLKAPFHIPLLRNPTHFPSINLPPYSYILLPPLTPQAHQHH